MVLGLFAVLAGSLVARQLWMTPPTPPPTAAPVTQSALVYQVPKPLPDFELTDDEGQRLTRDRLKGQWSLLFFGYTHCPDACPATLTQLAQLKKALADLKPSLMPMVWLVGVDPKRDTAAVLHDYVRFFSPDFHAMTGSPDAMEAFTRSLGIPVVFQAPINGNYIVDHSAAILLLNPNAELAAVLPAPHQVPVLSSDYRQIVSPRSTP